MILAAFNASHHSPASALSISTASVASVAASSDSGAQGLILCAHAAPLCIVLVATSAAVLRRLTRSSSRAGESGRKSTSSVASLLAYFAPFVTDQDVRQHRREQHNHSPASPASHLPKSAISLQGFHQQRKRLNRLLVVSLVQLVLTSTVTGYRIVADNAHAAFPFLSQSLAWALVSLRLFLRPPQTPSLLLAALLLSLTISSIVHLFSFVPWFAAQKVFASSQLAVVLLSATNVAISIYSTSLLLRMPIAPGGYEAVVDLDEQLRHHPDAVDKLHPTHQDLASTYQSCPTSPEDYCTLYENLSYSWMAPIQSLALRRSLVPTDVWRLRSINDTRLLFRKFKALLPPTPQDAPTLRTRLLSRILRANANDIALDACFKLISVSFAYLGTYILKSILDQIQLASANPPSDRANQPTQSVVPQSPDADLQWSPRQKAFVYAFIGLCLTVVRFIAELQNFHHARQVGLRLRSTLVVSLFEKALKRRDLSGQTKPTPSQSQAPEPTDAQADQLLEAVAIPDASASNTDQAAASIESDAVDHDRLHPVHAQASVLRNKPSRDTASGKLSLKQVSFGSIRSRVSQYAAYRKSRHAEALKKQEEEQGADVGKIVNMMASDVNILLRMGCDLHQLYGAPLEVTIAAVFLYKLMGWSALVGFSILVAAIPVNYVWGEVAVKKQREYSTARDQRMSLMTELVEAMRFVKIQGVESQWEERVAAARRNEIRKLIWSRFMTFLFELLWTVIPVLVTLVSFFFYVKIAKEELTVSTAFTAIALFTMIRPPLNAIPGFLMGGLIAMVSVQRLESFLNEQEVEEAISQLSRQRTATQTHSQAYRDEENAETPDHDSNNQLAIKNVTFRWHAKQSTASAVVSRNDREQTTSQTDYSDFCLRDISVDFPAGRLSLIIGPTGSGKSSMLAAILGEMLESQDGQVIRNKFDTSGASRFSYASQLPWLENGKSVRDNILFGTPLDAARYQTCIHACALQDDLDSMDDGDLTQIGSHTVSGGQKARISLARALYARSDTVLLDDVLSAVDTRVQRHLVRHALLGTLAHGRRLVLVTHHVDLLIDSAALVVCLRDGEIVHQGSPAESKAAGSVTLSASRSSQQQNSDTGTDGDAERDSPHPVSRPASASSQQGSSSEDVPSGKLATPERPVELASGARTPRLLHQEEKRREGAVSWMFYRTYLRASSLRIWALLLILLLLLRLSESFGQYWLKIWGEAYSKSSLQIAAIAQLCGLQVSFPPAQGHTSFYLTVYGLSGLAVIAFNSSRAVCFYVASIRASQNLFSKLLTNVIKAPLRWFDITPAGRIMNRFGTDMDCIDNILPQSIMNLGNNAFSIAAYFLICVAIVPAFLLPSLVLVLVGPWLVGGFLACTRDMQRIEATSTSPIYGHFQQALSGIVTIRAFGAEPRLLESMLDAVDLYQSLWWAVCTMEVWLSFRAQILGGVSVFVVTLLALFGAVSPGSAGLALSSAQLLCQLAYYLVNDFKNLANSFNSLERVAEYQQMPREENEKVLARYTPNLPPAGWPSAQGRIVFDNVRLRYAEELPEVLQGVSFEVKPGEKVGIIGRTGSGKSSLAASLFRAVELSGGRILIDDVDIKTIPLQQLRGRLSIVMQDPVLFSGTVRDNLDPFKEHDDAAVLDALRKVGLAATPNGNEHDRSYEPSLIDLSDTEGDVVPRGQQAHDADARHKSSERSTNMRLQLDSAVSSGGANFSAGQAQLLSLARSYVFFALSLIT